jgi:hypothetical protein
MHKTILIARMRVIFAYLSVCHEGLFVAKVSAWFQVPRAEALGPLAWPLLRALVWLWSGSFIGKGFCGFCFGSVGFLGTQS